MYRDGSLFTSTCLVAFVVYGASLGLFLSDVNHPSDGLPLLAEENPAWGEKNNPEDIGPDPSMGYLNVIDDITVLRPARLGKGTPPQVPDPPNPR